MYQSLLSRGAPKLIWGQRVSCQGHSCQFPDDVLSLKLLEIHFRTGYSTMVGFEITQSHVQPTPVGLLELCGSLQVSSSSLKFLMIQLLS